MKYQVIKASKDQAERIRWEKRRKNGRTYKV